MSPKNRVINANLHATPTWRPIKDRLKKKHQMKEAENKKTAEQKKEEEERKQKELEEQKRKEEEERKQKELEEKKKKEEEERKQKELEEQKRKEEEEQKQKDLEEKKKKEEEDAKRIIEAEKRFVSECTKLWTLELSPIVQKMLQDSIMTSMKAKRMMGASCLAETWLSHPLAIDIFRSCHDDVECNWDVTVTANRFRDVVDNLPKWEPLDPCSQSFTGPYQSLVLDMQKAWKVKNSGAPVVPPLSLDFYIRHCCLSMSEFCSHMTSTKIDEFFEHRRAGQTTVIENSKKKYVHTYLSANAKNLSDICRRTPPSSRIKCIGRDEELAKLRWQLMSQTKRVNVIKGPRGSGKTALMQGLVKFLLESDSSELKAIDVWHMDAISTSESQIVHVMNEVKSAAGKVWIIVENIDFLANAGQHPYMFGTTRDMKWKHSMVEIVPLTILLPQHSMAILHNQRHELEEFHHVKITDEAIQLSVQLARKHMDDDALVSPGRARWLLDLACSHAQLNIEVKPDELHRLEARQHHLDHQLAQFKESDVKVSSARINDVQKMLDEVSKQLIPLQARFADEKKFQSNTQQIRQEIRKYQQQQKTALYEADTASADSARERLKMLSQQIQASDARSKMTGAVVTVEHVASIVASYKDIPKQSLSENEQKRLMSLNGLLKKRVIDQDEAIDALTTSIIHASTGFKRPGGPIGSFLFIGPSGVGKTETAKAVAQLLFDDEKAMIRFDMSEFSAEHTVSRLIGSPPGYVGYDEGGQLTNAVKKRPYAVVLFDEIEKAHSNFLNLLLQILDDGRLTDGHGMMVDFSHTIVILTTNLGAQVFAKKFANISGSEIHNKNALTVLTSAERAELDACIKDTAKSGLRPEFLGRLDHKIYFSILGLEQVRKIAIIQLEILAKRLESKDMYLTWDESVVKFVTQAYEPTYGARMLRGHVEKKIGSLLSHAVLMREITEGTTIALTVVNNNVVWQCPTGLNNTNTNASAGSPPAACK